MPPAIDEFEDLTQFADESFDNDEVDLFEFTDDEESPLLRLKSIVLSLDWDITEETLAELTEELSDLRSLWDGDKVAQIYLQGMDNIGKYLRKEGAYANPNAIKLLLTLFYNYEKIISTTDLSSEAIAVMLKADVRKFKVLQYQIGTTGAEEHVREHVEEHGKEHVEEHVEAVPPPEAIIQGDTEGASVRREEADDPLTSMEATILGLEWDVTQEGLEKFHAEATELREHLTDNRDAQILVQGLQALGSYIREEKSNAHPDSFTILHAFYDALKLLIQDMNLTAEQRKRVLLEQIGSLNSLKAIIAASAAERAAGKSAGEERTGTKAAEAVETAEIPAPEQKLEEETEDEPEFDSPVADDDAELDLFSEDFDESSDLSADGEGVDEFFLDGDESLSDDDPADEESIAGDFDFDEEESGFDFDAEAGLDDDLFADETEGGEQDFALDNTEEE
ncbi:pilus assembly protein FimV, partial [Candidatus Electrothrix marina]